MRSVTGLSFSLLGSLEPNNTKKLVEIVDDLLIEAFAPAVWKLEWGTIVGEI
jgi:hypothetical protein